MRLLDTRLVFAIRGALEMHDSIGPHRLQDVAQRTRAQVGHHHLGALECSSGFAEIDSRDQLY